MAFPHKVTKQSEIPEGMETQYTERPDPTAGNQMAWFADVTGMVPKIALDEFRSKNTTLTTEVQTAQGQIATIAGFLKKEGDGDTVLDAATVAVRIGDLHQQIGLLSKQKDAKGTGLTKEDIEAAISAVKTDMNRTHVAALKTEKDVSNDLRGQLDSSMIGHELIEKASAAGVKPELLPMIQVYAKSVFRVDNMEGNGRRVVAMNENGQIDLGPDGVTPVGIDGWLTQIEKKMPSLFESSNGLGSRHSGRSLAAGVPAGINPWKKETRNLTQQGLIEAKNPEVASRLAAEAGVVLLSK